MLNNGHTTKKLLKKLLIGLLAFLLVFSTLSMVFIKISYDKNFPRYDQSRPGYLRYDDVSGYQRTVVRFSSGKNTLTGYVYGEGSQKGLVVIAPGRGEGVDFYLAQILYFVDHGWCVFAFDYTGSHASEGANSVGLPQSRIDLEAALAYIDSRDQLKDLPVLLFGHSWGGYAVTAVLADHNDISAVVSASGFNSPMGLMTEYMEGYVGFLAHLGYPFEWAYQSMLFGRYAWSTAVEGINRSNTPVMIIHDTADEAISYKGASIVAQRGQITNPDVVYVTRNTVDGSGHMDLFRSQAALQYKSQKNQEFRGLLDRYQGTVPDNEKAAFYAGIDRFQISELDAALMQQINRFFEEALQN